MAIYYVDSINGDNTNDGLTPGAAFADFFVDVGATVAEVPIFWVRRTSEIVLTENKSMNYGDIVYWPNSNEPRYNERPAAGITAGWDTDAEKSTGVDFSTFYISSESATDSKISFYNIPLFTISTANIPMFRATGLDFFGENMSINAARTAVDRGPLFYTVNGGSVELKVSFKDSTISATSTSLFSKNYDDRPNTGHGFSAEFDNCEVFLSYGVHWYDYSSKNQYSKRFNFTNNTVATFGGDVIYIRDCGSGYDYGDMIFNIKDSKVTARSLLGMHWVDSTYIPGLSFDIRDSEVYTTSSFFKMANNIGRPSYSSGRMNISGSKISFFSIFESHPNPISNNRYIHLDNRINVVNCEIIARSWMFDFRHLRRFSGVTFIGNKILSAAKGIIHARFERYATEYTDVTAPSYISVNNCSFGASLVSGTMRGVDIDVDNVNIAGYISDSDTSNISANAVYCDCLGAQGEGDYNFSKSSIINNTSSALNGVSSVTVRNSLLVSTQPLAATGGNIVVIDSEVETSLSSTGTRGRVRIFNSKLNSVNTAYESTGYNFHKEISPIYRINGADGSLLVSCEANKDLNVSSDELRANLTIASSSVIAHIAMPREIDENVDSITSVFHYVDTDGAGQAVPCTFSSDDISQWDGLPVGSKFYKLTADIAGLDRSEDHPSYMTISISSLAGPVKKIYLDLNLEVI